MESGQPITAQLLVHYRAIPNEEFDSVVDVVKRIIDLSPSGLTAPAPPHHHRGGPEQEG